MVPALICHLGTQISLHFHYAPGVSLIYLPIPLGMIMIQWWGLRVLPGVYLNALLCAGWWGLPQTAWWPLYALPETLAVGVSWLLFNRAAGGRCWMPAPRDLIAFFLLAILPAALIDGFQVPAQLWYSGELAADAFWRTAWSEWTATLFGGLGVALPLLYFLTPEMERRNLSRTTGASRQPLFAPSKSASLAMVEAGVILGAVLGCSLVFSAGPQWFVFAVLGLWAGLRHGLGLALVVNAWVVMLTLVLPALLPEASRFGSPGDVALIEMHLGLAVVCAVSAITGSTTSSLMNELRQRRAAENDLRESEFLFRSQFDLGNIGIAIISPDRRWLRVNKKLLTMFGYSDGEMGDLTWSEVSHPDDLAQSETQFQRVMAGEIDDYEMDKRYFRKDGSILRAHVTVACFRDADGTPRFNIASLYDVTEQWRLEEQLRQSQKMEAVGQLAGGVAHDFNNLLQAILGCGDMALEQTRPDSPIYSDLKEIVRTAHRATALVSQLLAFSRRQMLELKNHHLDDIVHDMSSMLRRVIREDIALRIDTRAGNGLVRADRGQVEQILMNLCVNARDAIGETGEITIRTRPLERPGEGDWICLSVADTGTGIDEETQKHLFEPFFTTKGPGEGSGLGLATVYGIVRQHNAIIEVESKPGYGATFHVFFPATQGQQTHPEAARAPVQRGGSECILIAEDDPSIRRLAVRFLEGAGYSVVAAEDGEAALDVLRVRASEFDLVVLDVIMPRLGGRGVYDYIHEHHPDLPVLFVSGYNAGEIHSGFVLNDGLAFIQKPYRRVDLLQRINEILHPDLASTARAINSPAASGSPTVPAAARR